MKFLNSAFVTSPAWLRHGDMLSMPLALYSSKSTFNVGGYKFTILDDDIQKYPSSLLFQLSEAKRVESGSSEDIDINRNGALFKYVNAFMVTGQLPRNEKGYIALDEKTLTDLQGEAEFYGLQTLSDSCSVNRKKPSDLETYVMS